MKRQAGSPAENHDQPIVLTRLDLFQNLSSTGRKLLAESVVLKQAASNEAILFRGQPVSGVFLVLKGRLRVFTIAPNGTEATLYFLDPGEACVLSINCLFQVLHYPAWVQAETDAEFAVIPGEVYRTLFASEPTIQDVTVQALSALVYRLMATLEQVHATNQRERLAHFILTHATAEGFLRTTQEQVARHLGTTREVIARLMQDLVARGAVKSQRGLISIRDRVELRRLVTPGSD